METMGYKNFKQTDLKWRDNRYSGETIGVSGCGPTVVADVVYHLNTTITPAKTAQWMQANGCACNGSGTYYSGIVKALKHYGYEGAVQLNWTSNYGKINTIVVKDFLLKIKSGEYVGIACMGKSIWTDSGHFVFIKAYDGKRITIFDPYNTKTVCESTTKSAWEKYVKYLFLIPKKLYTVKTTKKNVKIRKEHKVGKSAKIIAKLPKGTMLAIYKIYKGSKYTYGQVRYKGKMRWIVLKNTKKINE